MNRWKAALFCAAGMTASIAWYGPALGSTTFRGVNDFLSLYTGGVLAGTGQLYNTPKFLAVETTLTGYWSPGLTYVRLPWQAALMWPLARLPYAAACVVWQVILWTAIAMAIRLWPGPNLKTKTVACFCSFPLFTAFALGQDIPLVLLAITGVFVLRNSGRTFAAGLCLALCAAKIHLLWPFMAVVLYRGDRSLRYGWLTGGTALLGLSFLGGGAGWIPAFVEALRFNEGAAALQLMPNLHHFLAGTPWLEATAALAVLIAIQFSARYGDWRTGAAAALAGGLLIGRHSFIADCSLLLPAAAILYERLPQSRKWLLFILSPAACWPTFFGHPLITVLAICAVLGFSVYAAVARELDGSLRLPAIANA